MDLQREKSELMDSNKQRVSRLQTCLREQSRCNENRDTGARVPSTKLKSPRRAILKNKKRYKTEYSGYTASSRT